MNQSNNRKKLLSKTTTKIIVIAITVFVVVCLAINLLVELNNKKIAEQLATFGEQKFTEEILPSYILKLQENSFSDLEVTPHFTYDYDYSYNKFEKSIAMNCELEFQSTKIDSYYTTGYNGPRGNKLAELMKGIRSSYIDISETFTLPDIGTVTISIHKPDHEISVEATSGREYILVYGYIESVRVEIDGDWVYSANEANTDQIWGEVPYVGLSLDHINHTELGFYDDVEYCIDYYALRVDRRSATYKWYDAYGKEIFSAYVYGDEVISTTDLRNGKFVVTGLNGK